MTIREKFFNWFPKQDAEFISEKCEKIADEYAIEFTDWVNVNAYKYPTNTTTKELLEIFKKEKGL